MSTPTTRYAVTADGVHIAYQVVGNAEIDLVVLAWGLNIEGLWNGSDSSFARSLTSDARAIFIDRRGTGASDHVLNLDKQLTLESRADDIRAVMDAVGSDRAVLLGLEDTGLFVAAMFAATYPQRTLGLIAYGAAARTLWAPDYPWGTPPEVWETELRLMTEGWGTEELARAYLREVDPAKSDDPDEIRQFALWMRNVGGPGDALAWSKIDAETDIRELLPSIRVQTLVLHRAEDPAVPLGNAEYIASRIPGARLEAIPGGGHGYSIDAAVPSAVSRFMRELREQEAESDRMLATVLFTDIVSSTEAVASGGDHRWSKLVNDHHAIVRGLLARYRGTEMDTAGDGFFATFDGPARAVRCAEAIRDQVRSLGIQIRAGVHTGEVRSFDGKVGGLAVNIGARVASLAGASEVLATQTVRDLTAGSGLIFEDAGEHELKGVPDTWRLFRVVSERA